jgi:hypothetical protein
MEAVKRKYQMKPIEKLILKETKGLPPHALNEILDFIQFIKEKKLKQNGDDIFKSNLEIELSLLDKKELTHLEEEFKDYKDLRFFRDDARKKRPLRGSKCPIA